MNRPETLGVVFDLDGTLYATPSRLKTRVTWRLWNELATLRHVTGAREQIRAREFADGEELRAAFFEELSKRSGRAVPLCRSFYERRFLSAFVDVLAKRARPRTGLIEILGRLREADIRLAVVSDYSAIDERLNALEIDPALFDARLPAEDTGALKPSPRAFLRISEQFGLAPGSMLAIGDRPHMDEAAAAAAGMSFLGIADLAHPEYPPWASSAARLASIAAEVTGRSPSRTS
jgi:phosphoglycolate phosphatase-like HAD superfamily hydrolase